MSWHPLDQLDEEQARKLLRFEALLREVNQRINLISREDEEHIFERHILHSLAITVEPFRPGSTVIDWGTGGGLPAVPLAIASPDVRFVAVDAVAKKVRAVRAISRRLGLENVEAWQGRAEAYPGRAEYSVSRATAPLSDLWGWHERIRRAGGDAAHVGYRRVALICLKGGDLTDEVAGLRASAPHVQVRRRRLADLGSGGAYTDAYFEEKVLVECFTSQAAP